MCTDGFDFSRDLEPLLGTVAKPARYTGGEFNEVRKADPAVTFALAFPDVYEIGMSNLGLRILYEGVNRLDGIAAERVFAPWPDLDALLSSRGWPLFLLESKRPVRAADLLGFTLQYEMCGTNVLRMLELCGIPLLAAERGEDDPIVVAGGPCTCNPAPYAPFFDCFSIGDGDLAAGELAAAVLAAKRAGLPRAARLARLAELPWVWVPGLKETAARRVEPDLDALPFPVRQLVPNVKAVQDRGMLEASRGCTNGCRFCQAGTTYRPVRERGIDRLVDQAEELVRTTGFTELSLASLSISDYSDLPALLRRCNARLGPLGVSFSLPSLHVDGFTLGTAELVGELRKSGMTFAIEAGTEDLRRRLNKPVDEVRFHELVATVAGMGWRSLKLYFMLGFPHPERPGFVEGEVESIIGFVARLTAAFPKLAVNLNVGALVPKPHTPFQWGRQLSAAETRERLDAIRARFARGKVKVTWNAPELSFLEGCFARGGRAAGELLLAAYRRGARFDAWDEHFKWEHWDGAFKDLGLDPADFLDPFGGDTAAPLPWDGVLGVSDKSFLVRELARYRAPAPAAFGDDDGQTPDCRTGCRGHCGGCAPGVKPVASPPPAAGPAPPAPGEFDHLPRGRHVYRVEFEKAGLFRFTAHLDMVGHVMRALVRSGLPLAFSEGFNPKPRLSFALPVMLGAASYGDFLELELACELPAALVLERLAAALPAGMVPRRARRLETVKSRIVERIAAAAYRVTAAGPAQATDPAALAASLAELGLDPAVHLRADGSVLFPLHVKSMPTQREFLEQVYGMDSGTLAGAGLARTGLYVKTDDGFVEAYDA